MLRVCYLQGLGARPCDRRRLPSRQRPVQKSEARVRGCAREIVGDVVAVFCRWLCGCALSTSSASLAITNTAQTPKPTVSSQDRYSVLSCVPGPNFDTYHVYVA